MKKTRSNRRKNNMNPTKIGVIFIVSALALAGVGIGYSAWVDTITITGSVGTGSVGWHFIDYSGTYVWKVYGAPDTGYGLETVVTSDPTYSVDPANGFRVAYAEAVEGQDDHYAIVTYDNLFPCMDFEADVVIEYDGTVPGKINAVGFYDLDNHPENYWPEEGDEVLIDWYTDLYIDIYDGEDLIVENIDPALLMGYQLHYGYEIHIVMKIHLPQDDTLMGLSGNFGVFAEVVQWNEYPYTGGECGDEPDIGYNADVMLTLDTSGSIIGYEASLQDAAKAFVTALLSPDNGQVGIVSFASSAYLESTFSKDIPTLHGIIDGLGFGGGTNLEAGINLAQDELATMDRTPDADYPDYMVIITDGNPTVGGDPLDDATAAKAAGTRIFVLGIGIPDSTLLTQIASPGDYYDVADWDDLEAILLGLV